MYTVMLSLHLRDDLPWWFRTMMSKARWLAQHGGRLAGWRRVTRQVWFCMWWTGHTAWLFRTVQVALPGAAQLRTVGISSCCYTVNVHNHPSWATSRKEGMAWYSIRPMPSLWSRRKKARPAKAQCKQMKGRSININIKICLKRVFKGAASTIFKLKHQQIFIAGIFLANIGTYIRYE